MGLARESRALVGAFLALLGGSLMVYSGYVSRGFFLAALTFIQQSIGERLGGTAATVMSVLITGLALTAALGGFIVILGGVLILASRYTIGRSFIFLGGGAGFLGLVISFGLAVFTLGISAVAGYSAYWAGLALVVVSRRVMRKVQVKK